MNSCRRDLFPLWKLRLVLGWNTGIHADSLQRLGYFSHTAPLDCAMEKSETLHPVSLRVCLRVPKFVGSVATLVEAVDSPLVLQAEARAL